MTDQADILHGADEIAGFIGASLRQTYYMLERGHLPAAKLGAKWVARRSRILKHLDEQETATLARGRRDASAG